MFIQGQHIGVSETTYQQLRQANDLEKQPLHLKKGSGMSFINRQLVSVDNRSIGTRKAFDRGYELGHH